VKINTPTLGALCLAAVAVAAIFSIPVSRASLIKAPDNDRAQAWDAFGGNQQAQKYSTATQITPRNVKALTTAWSIHTGDVAKSRVEVSWEATPLFVNNTLYVGTPRFRIYAMAPDTGEVKWVYAAGGLTGKPESEGMHTRGVAYWAAATVQVGRPCQKMVYIGTMDGELHGVDADTGKPCKGFGYNGVVNIDRWNTINHKWTVALIQPPAVYKDTLVLGWSGFDWLYKTENPGTVYGIDARTGHLKWTFSPIPAEMRNQTGTANVWAGISIDPETGLAFLPVSSPSPNHYGGDRLKEMPLVDATVAVNAETGAVRWSRQLVHHDLWDMDINSAPVLVDIRRNGKSIPALVQANKMGMIVVLNRNTGEPIYPILEKAYPASDVKGEVAAKTQPFVPYPEPLVAERTPPVSAFADLTSFGECSRWKRGIRDEGRYTPPSLRGSLSWPATVGGVEWGGGAVDPTTGTYVVNASQVPQIITLVPRAEADKVLQGKLIGPNNLGALKGSPYATRYTNFLNMWGMPCWAPPYGTLSSYDLNTGRLNWRKPFGQIKEYGLYLPEAWGSITIGPPTITKSGLVFIGASMDSRVRAIDLRTGNVLWKHAVDAPVIAQPTVYTYKGREYVVFVAGGGLFIRHSSDQLIAFTLPN
jgi:quinoprotein glucose dehydrogenase